MLPPAVLWVDPGKMTGIATMTTEPFSPSGIGNGMPRWHANEWEFLDACQVIDVWCGAWHNRLAIGWERFDINSETHKKSPGGIKDALHVIGVCRFLAAKYGCRFLGEAQQHTPDKDDQRMLKALGWWTPGKDDAQSAAAHMLRWLIRENELTPLQRQLVYG